MAETFTLIGLDWRVDLYPVTVGVALIPLYSTIVSPGSAELIPDAAIVTVQVPPVVTTV